MRVKSESIHEHTEFLNEEKDIEGSRAVKKKMKEEREREREAKGGEEKGEGEGKGKRKCFEDWQIVSHVWEIYVYWHNDESISVKIIIRNS